MPKAEANAGKPPRFPYVAALLCAACVGAASWTWMRYSYCWPVTPADLRTPAPRTASAEDWLLWRSSLPGGLLDRYVLLRGEVLLESPHTGQLSLWVSDLVDPTARAWVALPREYRGGEHETREFVGRTSAWGVDGRHGVMVDARASRFHGASLAGLVVGAMGVFVFAVALRHWLRERRTVIVHEAS